ncbi:MAG: HNH endonuclease [Thermoplasmata archaeon]|nr:HNH endonuclease [Thermoplasmata archaeon]
MQKGETTIIYIHRLIMNAPHGIDVDHIDMDKLNNQRGNLRLCTRSQNMMNSGKRANNVSGYKGVSLVGGKYIRAQIRVNGEKIHLGNFPDSISAAKAHDEVARKYHGEFARTNF